MTAYDLLLLIATLCLVFLTGFACAVLYYLIRILQVWNTFSRETEQQVQRCVDHFQNVLHSFASFKNIAEIGLQTLKTVGVAYSASQQGKQTRKKRAQSEGEE